MADVGDVINCGATDKQAHHSVFRPGQIFFFAAEGIEKFNLGGRHEKVIVKGKDRKQGATKFGYGSIVPYKAQISQIATLYKQFICCAKCGREVRRAVVERLSGDIDIFNNICYN